MWWPGALETEGCVAGIGTVVLGVGLVEVVGVGTVGKDVVGTAPTAGTGVLLTEVKVDGLVDGV